MAHEVIGERRDGSIRIRTVNGFPQVEETFIFRVKADSKTATRSSVSQTTGLPQTGLSVSAGGLTVCKSKIGDRDPINPLYWDFTCEFSSEIEEGGEDPNTDPTEWVPIYETRFERATTVAVADLNGNPIANSAKERFTSGLTLFRFLPIWDFMQFEPSTVTDEQVIERNEVVNSTTFRGRAAKTLLCTVVSSRIGLYFGVRRRLTQYSLKYNRQGWEHRLLDVGKSFLDDSDPRKRRPYTINGQVVYGGLNGTGGKVDEGDPPAILKFDMYPQLDFGDFLRTD